MSRGGVFAVSRGVFDHPFFAKEPYTEREAWLWLVGEAAWEPRKARVGNDMIMLQRGQLAHSERFMAQRWGWNKSRVHRFLIRLKIEAMLDRESNRITICNYDKYAFKRTTDESKTEPEMNQTKEVKKKIVIDDDVGAGAREDAPASPEPTPAPSAGPKPEPELLISREAMALADEIAGVVGHDLEFVPLAWCGAAARVDAWLKAGWPRALILETVRTVMAHKRDGPPDSVRYFERAIAKAVASSAKPLPRVVIDNTEESVHVQRNDANRSLSQRAAALLADFTGPEPSGGPGSGATVVRLLSKG